MRILVCGGRDFSDKDAVFGALSIVFDWQYRDDVIVHGAATGVDSLAGEWAAKHGIEVEEYPADWTSHGKAAGPIRNKQMLNTLDPSTDLVLAFPGGRGTADMVRRAKNAGVMVMEVTP